MKTEDFDDAIRKKIESINPQFDEKDIDKVHDYVVKKRGSAFRLSNSNIVLASLLILAIAGLLTWNLYQKEERNQLVQTIDSLRKNLTLTESHAPVTKTDTIYETKYVNKSASNQQGAATNGKRNENINSAYVASGLTAGNIYSSSNKTAHAGINSRANRDNKKALSGNQYTASKISVAEKGNSAAKNNPDARQTEATKTNPAANESSSSSNLPGALTNQPANDTGVNKSIAKTNNPVTSDVAVNASPDSFPSDNNKLKKRSCFLNNLHYQVGVGYEIANASTGYSVNGEAILNNKWGVSIGAQLVQLGNELFDDDDDFHHKKGKDFSNVYPSDVTDTSSVSNIHIHTTLIRIPVKLNYYIALKHNYTLVFGAGTDMDVYAMERVGYNHKDNTNMVIPKNFNAMPSILLFNNATFSAGIQKAWRRFVFRAEPFISPQITDVEYKNVNLYFGIGLKILYAI